jgi:hypothetical protein
MLLSSAREYQHEIFGIVALSGVILSVRVRKWNQGMLKGAEVPYRFQRHVNTMVVQYLWSTQVCSIPLVLEEPMLSESSNCYVPLFMSGG